MPMVSTPVAAAASSDGADMMSTSAGASPGWSAALCTRVSPTGQTPAACQDGASFFPRAPRGTLPPGHGSVPAKNVRAVVSIFATTSVTRDGCPAQHKLAFDAGRGWLHT